MDKVLRETLSDKNNFLLLDSPVITSWNFWKSEKYTGRFLPLPKVCLHSLH